ncbi:ML5, partial [Symbiodinium sp. KB8]
AVGHRSFATQPTMNRQVSASSAGTENSSDGETTPWVETKQSERLVTEDLEAAIAESASPRSVPGREMRPPWLPQWPRRLHNPTALPRATRMFRNITPAPAPAAAAMRSVARRDGRCGVRFRAGRRRRDLASPQLEVNDDGTFDYPSARSWYTRKRFVKALSRETSLAKVRSSPAPGKQPAEEEEVGGDGREGSSEGEGEGSRSRSRPTSVAASRPDSARSRTDRSRANSEDGVPARTA